MDKRIKILIAPLLGLFIGLISGCASTSPDNDQSTAWVTTWATATENIREGFWMSKGHFPPKPLANDTLRMFMRTSLAGETVRIKLSNRFGKQPVTIKKAHISKAVTPDASAADGEIDLSTDTPLKFADSFSVTIPAGGTIYSDPVHFNLPALSVVALSLQYGQIAEKPITGHRGARTTSFFAKGDAVSNKNMQGAIRKDIWYTATAIEVIAPSSKTIVALGDSITDGYGTKYNHHTRWTDYLATRLAHNPKTKHIGIANVGIGGSSSKMGVERYKWDVENIQGAGYLIIFVGINDIVYGNNRSAPFVIDNYKKMAKNAREQGLKVYGATITPMGSNVTKGEKEAVRQQVNNWIRTTSVEQGIYDGVFDFDAIVRNPNKPTYLLPAYAVDDLHLNISGYKALAEAIDLSLFAQ
ncbi:GDSL-type esterase/lipase family protein [Catenovulum adriaticum]|uniref:GDSL-type esterase/lipase family protein n=1 Tax=Catenovulum adriaticum TaxID=2984846 RepID=A0ABY7AQU3_9ALTE|nr:GDSL-type esterase/lipase family protein [Catenovulum sp. TS8]WAJ71913.1 GDSL-type esterase/lipase family protein [Catenovulum sp. TS8]